MMRTVLVATAIAALAACSPASNHKQAENEATTADPGAVQPPGCNELQADMTKPVRLGAPPLAVAAVNDQLLGGPIPPGTYDLTGGNNVDGAPAWTQDRYVALQVSESNAGARLDYVEEKAGAPTERWTLYYADGTPATVNVTCGLGPASFAFASPNPSTLTLRIPDPSGTGAQVLVFSRRG